MKSEIPILVNVAGKMEIEIAGKRVSKAASGSEIGAKSHQEGGRFFLLEPVSGVVAAFSMNELTSIRMVYGRNHTHILGQYSPAAGPAGDIDYCCVELCGVIVCAQSVCVRCGRTTACCGDLTPGDMDLLNQVATRF